MTVRRENQWVAKHHADADGKVYNKKLFNIYDENGRHRGAMRVGKNKLCVHDGPPFLTLRDCLPERQDENEIYVWAAKENVKAALNKFRALKLKKGD